MRWEWCLGIGAVSLSACSFLVDLDGLSGAVGRATSGDAGLPADAGQDRDARADGGCRGTKGPSSIRVGTYCIDATEVRGRDYNEFLAAKAGDTRGQPPECA